MAEPDIFSLFMGAPDAAAQAQAQAEALRRRRGEAALARNAGNVALLSGDRVLSNFGNAQLRQAGEGDAEAGRMEGLIAQAGGQGAGRALQEALAARQQAFQAGQGALGRGLQRELAGMEDTRARDKMKADAEVARLKAETDKGAAAQKTTADLRKELMGSPVARAHQDVETAWTKIKSAAGQPTAAGDLSLIFSYMRLLDPGSSVKETEFANAQNAGSVPERIWAQYNRIKAGERLTPDMRADFMQHAALLHGAHESQFQRYADFYRGQATKAGVSPEDVVVPTGAQAAPEAATGAARRTARNPQTGEVQSVDSEAEAANYKANGWEVQ